MKALYAGLLLALAACASMPLPSSAQGEAAISVVQAWIRPAAMGQFETWAFATISNPGKADALIEVRSPDASSVVLRAATVTDAGRKMRSVLAIPLLAGRHLTLSTDTYFIAFIEAKHAFATGQPVTATLRFASGALIPVTFQVAEAAADPSEAGN